MGAMTALGAAVLHFLWQGALIGALLWALLACLPRDAARRRYALSMAALALALASFATTAVLALPGGAWIGEAVVGDAALAEAAGLSLEARPDARRGLRLAALAWVVGASAMTLRAVVQGRCALRLKRVGVAPVEGEWLAAFEALKARLGVARGVRLLQSTRIEVPMVVGWLSPVVLVPAAAFTGIAPDQLRALLAHELAHLRRYDQWQNVFQAAVEVVLFFHPVVWWISGQVRLEREACCDDLSVRVTEQPGSLAEALVAMEQLRSAIDSNPAGAADLVLASQTPQGGILMHRISRILGVQAPRHLATGWQLPAGLLLAGTVALGGARAAHGPHEPTVPPELTEPHEPHEPLEHRAQETTANREARALAEELLRNAQAEREIAAANERLRVLEAAEREAQVALEAAQAAQREHANRQEYVNRQEYARYRERDANLARQLIEQGLAAERQQAQNAQVKARHEAARIKESVRDGLLSREQAALRIAELEHLLAAAQAELSRREQLGQIGRYYERARRYERDERGDAELERAALEARLGQELEAGRMTKDQAGSVLDQYRERLKVREGLPYREGRTRERRPAQSAERRSIELEAQALTRAKHDLNRLYERAQQVELERALREQAGEAREADAARAQLLELERRVYEREQALRQLQETELREREAQKARSRYQRAVELSGGSGTKEI